MEAKYKLVMVRHGESEWNRQNRFTGWFDAELSEKGARDAEKAGKLLKEAEYKFDVAFTSLLRRAQMTLQIIAESTGDVSTVKTWRLNERHYGSLTGMNKDAASEEYGRDRVNAWRRSLDVPPPKMEESHSYYDVIHKDARYKDIREIPCNESLEMCILRTLPFWEDAIVPAVKSGKSCIVAGHGNNLRGLVKHLEELTNEEAAKLSLPVGVPFVYELNESCKPVGKMRFIGEEQRNTININKI